MCASVPDGFVDLISQIWSENPGVWTDEAAYEACLDEILGMSAEQFAEYVEHIADRRLGQPDFPERYGTDNPFPLLSE